MGGAVRYPEAGYREAYPATFIYCTGCAALKLPILAAWYPFLFLRYALRDVRNLNKVFSRSRLA